MPRRSVSASSRPNAAPALRTNCAVPRIDPGHRRRRARGYCSAAGVMLRVRYAPRSSDAREAASGRGLMQDRARGRTASSRGSRLMRTRYFAASERAGQTFAALVPRNPAGRTTARHRHSWPKPCCLPVPRHRRTRWRTGAPNSRRLHETLKGAGDRGAAAAIDELLARDPRRRRHRRAAPLTLVRARLSMRATDARR